MRFLPLLGLLACGTTSDPEPELSTCDALAPDSAPLRMLTRTQVDLSLDTLMQVEGSARTRLPSDSTVHGFEGFAAAGAMSPLIADGWMRVAEDATSQADWSTLLPCDPAEIDASCATTFIDTFGTRAWRRPLTEDERQVFEDLFAVLATEQSETEGIAAVVQAMLLSPQFVYRVELGDQGAADEVLPLTDWEIAARLSFLLWNSTPDEELLAAAEAGMLRDPTGLAEQVDRLLADDRARHVTGRFVEQWLGVGRLETTTRDAIAYPDWSPELATDLREETRRFTADVIFDGDGTLESLLTAPYTIANSRVADHYGLSGSPSVEEWLLLNLPAGQRSGLLTHPSLLASTAHSNQTSPVHRGLVVFEKLFCGVQPQPPDDLDITLPALDEDLTTRERFARHIQDPTCSECHRFMDPIGFGFEHYDATGAWRDEEVPGTPVDASGLLTYSSQQGEFVGAVELAAKLAAAPEVEQCFVTQWFRATWGRDPRPEDECTIAEMTQQLRDGDILEMLSAIPHTATFQVREAGVP